jgi:ribosomal protein S1
VGDVVSGLVIRRIEQGLLVAISFQAGPATRSVNAFLPESEAAIPSPAYLDEFHFWTIECEVIEIDELLGHVVVCRRRNDGRWRSASP